MPDYPTSGTATSFTNTPQAKNDSYSYLEDVLRANSTLYNAATNTITLDVMSNDLGGAAKTLYSVEDGDGNPITADYDLLAKDVNAAGVSPWEPTKNGNWVRINNGRIEYRIADGSGVPGQGVPVDSLSAGQIFNDEFVYAIRLGNGTLSQATVKINITGANDSAAITAAPMGDYSVAEAGVNPGNTAFPGDPSAGGTLVVTDVDAGEAKFQSPSSGALSGTYGTFTFDSNTGQWTYTLDDGRAATQQLSQGQAVTETLTVTSLDGTATHTIVVNVTGTNDGPVITSSAQSGTVTEDTALTAGGQVTASDVDNDAVLGYTGSATGTYGSFAVNASTGEWTYTLDNANHQDLAAGETQVENFSVTVTDEHGATASQFVTIIITGTNDGPVITSSAQSGAVTEDTALTAGGQVSAMDVDSGAVLTYSGNATGTYGSFAVNASTGEWTYTLDNTNHQDLAAGETQVENFSVTVTDEHGATASQFVTIIITGTNDGPVITSSAQSGAVTEDTALTAGGQVTAMDVDSGAVLTYSGNATGTYGSFAVNASTGEWTYTLDNTNHQDLAAGETHTETFTVTVTDEHGASATQTVTITVTGTNDGPVITSSAQSGAVKEDVTLSVSGQVTASDVDNDAVLGYTGSATGTYGSFAVNASTGEWTYTLDNTNHQDLAAGETQVETFTVTVTDEHGASATQTVTITVTGTNDVPVASAAVAALDEDSTVSGSVSATDADAGETASLTYALVGSAPAGLTFNANGSYEFDASSYDSLREGEELELTVPFTATDVQGATSVPANLVITITGINDGPVLSDTVDPGAVTEATNASAQDIGPLSGTFAVVDIDVGDTLTPTVVGSPVVQLNGGSFVLPVSAAALVASGALTLTGATSNGGTASVGYSYDPGAANLDFLAAGDSLTITYTVQVSDGIATSGAQTVTFTITGSNDAPVVSAAVSATADEDDPAPVSVDLLANASDPDRTDELDVASVGYTVTSGTWAAAVAYSVNAETGELTFDPGQFNALGASESVELTFTYDVVDGNGGVTPATAVVTITGSNDAPVVSATNSVTTNEDTASAAVAIGATDVDGDTLSYSLASGGSPAHGTVSFNQSAGTFVYTPAANYNGTDSFTILIDDGHGGRAEQVVNVTVGAVNDGPVNTVPGGQSVDEDSTLTFSGANAISVSDLDVNETASPDNTMQVQLIVSNGKLALGTTSGVTITDGANDSSTVTIQGTVAAINAALAGIAYTPNANFSGSDTLQIVTSDLGHTGSGGVLTDTDTVAITVNPVNDAPINTLPASFAAAEDTPLQLTGLSVSDVDAGTGTISVTLGVSSGTLAASNGGGVTVTGSGTNSIVLSGTLVAINAYLASSASQPTFTPVANANGAVTLTMTTSDGGNSGAGGAQSDTDTSTINVAAVNDGPTASPVTLAAIAEDSGPRLITQAQLLAGAGDVDGPSLTITSLIIASGSGSLVANGDGTWTYTPAPNDDTGVTFNYTVFDGSLAASSTANLDITPVNDAPVNAVPAGTQSATAGSAVSIGGVSVGDVDSTSLTTTLSVLHGTLSVTAGGGTTIGGNGTGTVTLSGTQAQINAALAGLSYTATVGYSGSDTLSVNTSDGALSDVDNVAISVSSPVPAPVANDDVVYISSGTNPSTFSLSSFLANDIVNGATFTITGGSATYDAATQTITLTSANPGTITYSLTNGGGSDSATVTVNVISVGGNADTVNLSGNGYAASYVDLRGGTDSFTGSTVIVGSSGDDQVIGGTGDDRIDAKGGNNTLMGGDNADDFVITNWAGMTNHITDFNAGTSSTTVDQLFLDLTPGANTFSIGNNNSTVDGFKLSTAPGGTNVAGTEVVVNNSASFADSAGIQAYIDGHTNLSQGALFVVFNSGLGHAGVYYDANPSAAGGAVLVAELDNITSFSALGNFNSGDFVFF